MAKHRTFFGMRNSAFTSILKFNYFALIFMSGSENCPCKGLFTPLQTRSEIYASPKEILFIQDVTKILGAVYVEKASPRNRT